MGQTLAWKRSERHFMSELESPVSAYCSLLSPYGQPGQAEVSMRWRRREGERERERQREGVQRERRRGVGVGGEMGALM